MHAKTETYQRHVAYYLRRAAEERGKAEAAPNADVRDGRLKLAAIFEARARELPGR